MIDFDVWWNSAAADEFRDKHEDMDGSEVRPIWAAAVLATLAHTKTAIDRAEAVEQQAEPGADERSASEAYDKVDRFLRNNLDDVDYAEYSEALECVRVAQSGQRAGDMQAEFETWSYRKILHSVSEAWEVWQVAYHAGQRAGVAGWKLVPVEPTDEMLNAGAICHHLSDTWSQMIAAAPTPAAQGGV